ARSSKATPTRLPGTIEETAQQVQALGRRAVAVRCDISHEEQVEALLKRTLAEFGRIDILINNAAVNYSAPFAATPMKRWDLVLNVNLRGTVLCTKAYLPKMLMQRSGRIINVSSGAATDAQATVDFGVLAYSVSKAAVETFTQGLALELRPHAIAVNCLRIEMGIASEGPVSLNPDIDYSTWEKPRAAAEALLWLAARERSYTGHVATIAAVRQATRG
ncbi:MAG: SDR family NAD(P)-dependent oxidoreductase, partial [Candidatus Binatia bacterium]